MKNPQLHDRSKHIDICYHYIRDLEEQGKISVSYIPTGDMIADGLTKPLQRVAFGRFRSLLGVTSLEEPKQGPKSCSQEGLDLSEGRNL